MKPQHVVNTYRLTAGSEAVSDIPPKVTMALTYL